MAAPVQTIPILHAGDRLTAEEFLRRYEEMPEIKKAELIEGVVYMPSPVSLEDHGAPHFDLIGVLAYYRAFTPGVQGADNATVCLDPDNVPQPDIFLRILPEYGGQSSMRGKYVEGAPELIAEIAASSASYDLHDKLKSYRRNGVLEYVIWRVFDKTVDWFILREGRYVPLPLSSDGFYRSTVFPGLWLDPVALVKGDARRLFQIIQDGIGSPEHADFVRNLAAARKKN